MQRCTASAVVDIDVGSFFNQRLHDLNSRSASLLLHCRYIDIVHIHGFDTHVSTTMHFAVAKFKFHVLPTNVCFVFFLNWKRLTPYQTFLQIETKSGIRNCFQINTEHHTTTLEYRQAMHRHVVSCDFDISWSLRVSFSSTVLFVSSFTNCRKTNISNALKWNLAVFWLACVYIRGGIQKSLPWGT